MESAGRDSDATSIWRAERKTFAQSCMRAPSPWSLALAAVRVKRGSVTGGMIPLMRVGISEVNRREEEGMVEVL